MASFGKVFALISATVVFAGSDADASDPKSATCARLEIGGKSYAMLIPKGSVVKAESTSGLVAAVPVPNGRLVRFFSLRPSGQSKLPPANRTSRLENASRIAYVQNNDVGGGSGGTEAELVGELTLTDGLQLHVTCHDQSEWSPNPAWCLKHLGTIAVAGSASACSPG